MQPDPLSWQRLTADWRKEGADAAWLTYSANYLLRTAGVRWALDPFWPPSRLGLPLPPVAAEDLRGLNLVVLSHAHADHLDFNLLAALASQPIQWVIPAHMREKIASRVPVPPERVMVPVNGQPLCFGGLTLMPFDGLHFHGAHGVPETGYLVEFGGRRWLFLGDTRDYRRELLPPLGAVDGVFAHLWLGRACAALPVPPLVEEFSRFFIDLNARRVVVTHLYEAGRDETDLWTDRHFRMVKERIIAIAPGVQVECAVTGDCIFLNYQNFSRWAGWLKVKLKNHEISYLIG
jgi:hypothetical protein